MPTTASPTLEHVHETIETVETVELSPPHPPREETPEYARAHHFIVYEKKALCQVCKVNIDTLGDPTVNIWHAKAMETHHYPVERSLATACDLMKVHRDFPMVYNRETLMAFVDSPANLICLCDVHHRSLDHGIHHLLPADFAIQQYLLDGYIVAATSREVTQALAQDEVVMQQTGVEQAVVQEMAAHVAIPATVDKTEKTPRTTGSAGAAPMTTGQPKKKQQKNSKSKKSSNGKRTPPSPSTAQPATPRRARRPAA